MMSIISLFLSILNFFKVDIQTVGKFLKRKFPGKYFGILFRRETHSCLSARKPLDLRSPRQQLLDIYSEQELLALCKLSSHHYRVDLSFLDRIKY